jgi:hypothetical protein
VTLAQLARVIDTRCSKASLFLQKEIVELSDPYLITPSPSLARGSALEVGYCEVRIRALRKPAGTYGDTQLYTHLLAIAFYVSKKKECFLSARIVIFTPPSDSPPI